MYQYDMFFSAAITSYIVDIGATDYPVSLTWQMYLHFCYCYMSVVRLCTIHLNIYQTANRSKYFTYFVDLSDWSHRWSDAKMADGIHGTHG